MGQQGYLEQSIQSGKPILIVEMTPPPHGDAECVKTSAKRFAGKVHAVGVSDNRDGIRMSALATASLIAGEGVEPILHVVTRDRNRIALSSECMGAQALGVRSLLCTTGTHQTLGSCGNARNVFDIDSVQLLQTYRDISESGNGDSIHLCLGAAVSPFADPIELQLMKAEKKIAAGARFLITQPVFDTDRFEKWWSEVTSRSLQEKTAIIAGIKVLTDADEAKAYAEQSPKPMIPASLLERLCAKTDKVEQRAEGIEIAAETIKKLSALDGLRGFEIRCDADDEVALELIDKAGLRCD